MGPSCKLLTTLSFLSRAEYPLFQAKLWNLVVVCEHNQCGMGASAARSLSNTEYCSR